jgi:uncharacterized glyoxalase superfamily protein PhnB
MPDFAKDCTATIIPALRYKDAPAAIEWLCKALGFKKHVVYPNPDGTIGHCQLTFGNGMIMIGSAVESEFNKFCVSPGDAGNRITQSPYLVVNDADAVYATAKAAGAEIILDIRDQDYGGRDFTCRDPEGHLWTVGTFDPWASPM